MTTVRRILATIACVAFASAVYAQAQQPPTAAPAQAASGMLKVSVEYKGAGTVDADHRIVVWLFDTPNITADSEPVASGTIKTNKGDYKFVNLPKEVYIAVAYDDKGGYDGTSGPPPQGTPVSIHGATALGTPGTPVPTGDENASVTVTFDDSVRMP